MRYGGVAAAVLLLLFTLGAVGLELTAREHRRIVAALRQDRWKVIAVLPIGAGGWTPLNSISPTLVCAILAVQKESGRSIPMQLARELLPGPPGNPWRALRRYVLTRELSRGLQGERSLELYLNLVAWEPGLRGISEASRYWFGKTPRALGHTEAVLLATRVHDSVPVGRLWAGMALDEVTRSVTAARLERWEFHLRRGLPPVQARKLVALEMGPEPEVRMDSCSPKRRR